MRWLRINVYIGAAFTAAFYIATFVPAIVFQVPKAGQTWTTHEMTAEEQSKIPPVGLVVTAGGFVLDLFLFTLPIRAVMQLQLPPRRKVGVAIVFALGFV